jgi:tRNA dimethylallyltransferase
MVDTDFKTYNLVTVLGPTATGKTQLAAQLAFRLNSDVISADSRQVYKGMSIGTGKDLGDFSVDGTSVPYHLIDICEAGEKYNVFEFQKDFFKIYSDLRNQNKVPVMCGGSGLYLDAALHAYELVPVPVNEELREELSQYAMNELVDRLKSLHNLHNKTDICNRKRLIRAIEIAEYSVNHQFPNKDYPQINSLCVGIYFDRETRRQRITSRLLQRLSDGMVEEVKTLLNNGISPDDLIYYGLEYKFVTLFILGKISYNEMFTQLEIAIHQFAKRQMTWFRKMEKEGVDIHWIDGNLPLNEKVDNVMLLLKK